MLVLSYSFGSVEVMQRTSYAQNIEHVQHNYAAQRDHKMYIIFEAISNI